MEQIFSASIGNPDRFVHLNYLMTILCCGRTTAWRKLKSGLVPPPMYLGSSKPCWKKSVLDNWIAGLAEAQMTKPEPKVKAATTVLGTEGSNHHE